MEYLRFATDIEARDYDHVLLMEMAEVMGLSVNDGKVLGMKDGQVTDEYPTTSWSNVFQVEGVGWLVSIPDWRDLNAVEMAMIVEWSADIMNEFR